MRYIEKITLFALAALMMPSVALAQDITPMDVSRFFSTDTGDPFTSVFLHQIFGPIFPSITGVTVDTVFSKMVGYFNVLVLVVGGMMLFWNATVGLMQSAHEGKILGSRWSSLWAPLRILFAIGLMVPMPGLGGYNLGQAGIAYIVKGSTNVASAFWSSAATLVVTGKIPITVPEPEVDPAVVRTLFMNIACQAVLTDQMNIAAGKKTVPYEMRIKIITDLMDGSQAYQTELYRNGAVTHPNICGSYRTPPIPEYLSRDKFKRVAVEGVLIEDQDQLMDKWAEMHMTSANDINSEFAKLTENLLPFMKDRGPNLPDISSNIEKIVLSSKETLNNGAQEIISIVTDGEGWVKSREALLNRIKGSNDGACAKTVSAGAITQCYGEGWIGAGSWYMMMAQINNEMTSLFTASPQADLGIYVSNPNMLDRSMGISNPESVSSYMGDAAYSGDMRSDPTGIQLILDRYAQTFDQSVDGLAALGFPMSASSLASVSRSNSDTASGLLEKIDGLGHWTDRARDDAIAWMSPSNTDMWGEDPMIALATMGQFLIDGAGIIITGVALVALLAGPALAVVLSPIVVTLLTAGSVLAFLLPILPFIFWVLAVTGYFILIVEAMIAINLWALSHMRLDGEGLSGEGGRQGWLMILSLLFTPVLMIFGFLIGMIIFRVSTAIINMGIFQAMSGIMGSGWWVDIIAVAAFSIFMAIFYMILVERSFSLVTEFPGRVLRLMGASSELTRGEEGKARMAAAGAGVAVARGSGMVTQSGAKSLGYIGVGRNGNPTSGARPGSPENHGMSRRLLEGTTTTASEGDGRGMSALKRLGRGAQRAIGLRPNSIGPGGPKSGG